MKKILLFFTLPLLLASCTNSSGNNGGSHIDPPPAPVDFEDVYFDSKTLTYDGDAHILDEVRGAPEGTNIVYTGREYFTNVGTYTASALLTKDGYNDKTLTATLKITNASFSNITFEGATFEYDGEEHSIYVSGAPSFATVKYTNNGKKSVGTYTVTATISAPNYNNLTLTAILKITGRNITGVTLNDKSFQYDGKSHSLEVEGTLPIGVSVSYSNNGKVDSGSYKVTATLSGEGYNSLQLTATLTITPIPLSNPGYFNSRAYIYDGQNHSITVTYAPSSATITYRCLNATGTNTFKNAGTYVVEATVKTDKNHASVMTAYLIIANEGTVGVDPNKEALTIDKDLTWDELYEALEKDNFTQTYYSGFYDQETLDEDIPENIINEDFEGHNTFAIFGSDGKEAYSKVHYTNTDVYDVYDYYKEYNDSIIHLEIDTDPDIHSGSYSTFPKAAFSETVAKIEAGRALVALTKGENGEFLVGADGDDFYGDIGIPYVEDGAFSVLMIHSRTLDSGDYRYFYRVYKYSNIGNTKVTLPSTCTPKDEIVIKEMGYDEYYLGGVRYSYTLYGSYPYYKYYYSAHLYVTYLRAVFLKPGTYTVLPYYHDKVITAINTSTLSRLPNYHQKGYIFNLYVDSDKNYQGEYSELGTLDRFTIKEFLNYGGEVRYYDEWHN